MYKQVKESYVLTEKDKLVLTFENGKIMVLINNEIKIDPQSLHISTEGYDIKDLNYGKVGTFITRLNIECEVKS